MENEKKLSIIYVNYRSKELLKKSIASLAQKPGLADDAEIIVVNNDPEESLDNINQTFSAVTIIDQKKNLGLGAGTNLGARYARGKYLWILNADTEVLTQNIQEVKDILDKDASVGVVGSKLALPSGKTQEWSAGVEVSLWNLLRNNLGLAKSRLVWESSEIIECDWVAATSLFIPKGLFDKLGGFDERIFMYFEDMDLCTRARKLGYKVMYFPQFSVTHFGGSSYSDNAAQKKHYYDSQEYYFRKHKGWWQWVLLKLVRVLFVKM